MKNLGINNVKIFSKTFKDGFVEESPYDLIFVDNPVYEITNSLKNQLSSNAGKIIMIKRIKVNQVIGSIIEVGFHKNNL